MRKGEKRSKFIFNKVYTGEYLVHNLGHEVINFIKTDNNKRYIYLNPWGNRNENNIKNLEYVVHFMKVPYMNKSRFELIAISKIDTQAKSIYNKDLDKEIDDTLVFHNHTFSEIFKDNEKKNHLYSFKASKLYKPKNKYRIFINFNSNKSDIVPDKDNKVITIYVECHTNRNIAYSKNNDDSILEKLFQNGYLKETDDNIDLDNCDDEQCFAVISDRTHLENSLSNQIAYFLSRDKENLLKPFIELINEKAKNNKDKPDKIDVNKVKDFKIFREMKKIDLLFKSNNHVIIIENKIDSYINGIASSSAKKKNSQLSKYYEFVMKDKDNNFKGILPQNKLFFILEPEYSSITREKLDKDFKNGDVYNIIYYKDLYNILENNEYAPYENDVEPKKRQFLYDQFKKEIEYVISSRAEQNQKISYIRLKQRIKELDEEKNINTEKKA